MKLPQLAKRLDEQAAQPSGRRHVLGRRSAELDGGRADPDRPGRAVRQEHHLGGHLFGMPQSIRGMRSSRLEPRSVVSRQRPGDRLG